MVVEAKVPPAASRPAAQLENEEEVSLADLLARVQERRQAGMRFVTATCLDLGGKLEVLYHFDADLKLSTLRLTVDKDAAVPSISGIYLCAFLVENEMKELFGLRVKDIAIDYQGRLLLSEGGPITPMLKSAPGAQGNA